MARTGGSLPAAGTRIQRASDQTATLDAQVRDLTVAGAEHIFGEQVSSAAKRVPSCAKATC
jgi:hypothetical protein